jgi:hypothetical protein
MLAQPMGPVHRLIRSTYIAPQRKDSTLDTMLNCILCFGQLTCSAAAENKFIKVIFMQVLQNLINVLSIDNASIRFGVTPRLGTELTTKKLIDFTGVPMQR